MKRVGILGGTFDPPHNAHVAIAEAALRRVPLERVMVMPAPTPPQKQTQKVTPYARRVEMVRLAFDGHDGLELSLLEEFRDGPSYTVDLLRHFRESSGDEPFLVLGADSVHDLPNWKAPGSILELATLVVFPRTGFSSVVRVGGRASIVLFEEPVIDVSSTDIRQWIKAGVPVESHLPDRVHEFILDNDLYS
jgi:nicotinate-nucleotide adenylyltransferase